MSEKQTIAECLEQASRLNSMSDVVARNMIIALAKSSGEHFEQLIRLIDKDELLSMIEEHLADDGDITATVFSEMFVVQSKYCDGDSIAFVGNITD